jgi:hypothetical protein
MSALAGACASALRVLRLYWYYFSWQRIMGWLTLIGLATLLLGFTLTPSPLGMVLMALGSVLAVAFPIVFAGVAYRALIANRRFVMLPNLRTYAAVALLLLALTASAIALVVAAALKDLAGPPALELGLIAFSTVSVYLLMSQWVTTYPLGFLSLALLPLFLFRMVAAGREVVSAPLTSATAVAALACVGWVWLVIATRGATPPRPLAQRRQASRASPQLSETRVNYQWMPHGGPAATPAGTLLRGARDGWRNRIYMAVLCLVSVPVITGFVPWILGQSFGGARRVAGEWFLLWSVVGLTLQMAFAFGEWPARLRTLWLRMRGDRAAGWRLMERTLLVETLIIGVIATITAAGFWLLTAVSPAYLLLYICACMVMAFVGSYCGFWIRASGRHWVALALFTLCVVLIPLGTIAALPAIRSADRLCWLLLLLGVLALVLRALARRRLRRVDWCAVRPTRLDRMNAL